MLTLCNLFCFEISFAQESYDGTNTPRQYYYNNLESATTGTASPTTYFPSCATSQTTPAAIKLASASSLNSTNSFSTVGSSTLGTITWNFINNSATAANLSLNSAPWEWEFDYKNTSGAATVDPDATSTSMVAGSDSWRYWLISSLSGSTKMGIYVTQVGGKLEGRQRYGTIASQYRVLWDVAMPNNKDTYQIRIERSVTGYYNVFVFDRTASTTQSSLNINANYDSVYNLSYLDATSAAADRFQFDNFNFYQVRLDYLPISGNGVSSPLYPGMGTAILYGMNLCARGDIVMGRLVIDYNSGLANIIGINVPGYLYETSTLPLSTSGLSPIMTYTLQNNGASSQQDLSGLNLRYYNGGNTDGSTGHITYYFLTAAVMSTFTTPYPSSVSYSVSNTNNDSYSQFFNSSSPYSSNSSSSVSAPINNGDLWEWTGLTAATWTTQKAWKKDNTITASSIGPSATTDIVKIGVTQYSSSTVQPQLPSDITVSSLEIGPFGSNTSTTTPVSIDFAGHKLTVNNGLTIDAGATLTLQNTSATVGNLAVAGTSTMASTATMTWPTTTTNGIAVTNTGTFTLVSDASGAASIGAMTATSSITGTIIVQRYLTGGLANSRGYRLLSSPVSVSSSSLIIPNLSYINNGSYTTGTGGTGSGFSAPSNGGPTLYFYRENIAPNNSNFTSGNFRGVSNITGSTFSFDGGIDASATLPAGNGFMFFFRGSKATSNPYVSSTIAKATTFSSSGYLNQGDVKVRDWFNPTVTDFTLSYNPSKNSVTAGYHLVGNPYPSSIDWDKVSASNAGVGATIYIYNPTKKTYATYLAGTPLGVGTNFNASTGNNIISSGQGFFVTVTNTSTTLTFHESNKSTTQVSSSALSLATATTAPDVQPKYLSVELFKDSTASEDALILFKPSAKAAYVYNEDADYMKGNSAVNLSTRSSDNIALAINQMNFPSSSQVIPLNVNMTAAGNYQIKLLTAKNIPAAYDVWLMDAYKKDSLDLKNNPVYTFEANVDTNTYGNHRFSLVIRQNVALTVHLLSFDAVKSTNDVKLKWTAENEADYTGYVVERSTDGGKTFKVIDSLTSAGLGTYNDLDPSPILGTNYYRLKQTDVAGNVSYSNIVKIMYANVLNTVLANSNISVYPNPAQSTLNLTVTGSNNNDLVAATYKISIVNSSGMLVKTATSTSGSWQAQIDNLMPGTYFIQVINSKNNTLTGKSTFVKL